MRLFLLAALTFFITAPAFAQDLLREHRQTDPSAKLLEDKSAPEKTITDYSNSYYESCVAGNTDKSLDEYVKTQCACTTAEMSKFMTLQDMINLFEVGAEGDFQQARVMSLAYIPCTYQSIYNLIYDNCYYNDMTRKNLLRSKKVCQCYAHAMGNHVASRGENLIPGFTRKGFDRTKGVDNPLAHVIGQTVFEEKSNSEFNRCVMVVERGWAK